MTIYSKEQKPTSFRFWWPTTETGGKTMAFALTAIGFLSCSLSSEAGLRPIPIGAVTLVASYLTFNSYRFYCHRSGRNMADAPFNFWWPTSRANGKVMFWFLSLVAVVCWIKGCNEVAGYISSKIGQFYEVLILYFAVGVGSWYFIINVGRYAYSRIIRSETVQRRQETRGEKEELDSLRRRIEIKRLKEELGDDDAG